MKRCVRLGKTKKCENVNTEDSVEDELPKVRNQPEQDFPFSTYCAIDTENTASDT